MSEEAQQSARYFYVAHGGAYGPVAWSELEHRASSGTIQRDTLVREETAERWKQAGSLDLPFPADSSPDIPPPATVAKPASSGDALWNAVGLLAVAGAIAWWLWPAGFSDADIEKAKSLIRAEYAKQRSDLQIEDVSLIRRDKRELTGFVKLKDPSSGDAQTIDCKATMDDSGKQFVWSCGR